MNQRRALFFLVAALACVALVPASDSSLRWVPKAVAALYTVLAVASYLDARFGRGRGS